jgi:hypothetical protein
MSCWERSIAMASIPIHNETDYTLTEAMTQQIIRDAQEHFGEEVSSIRVQAGIARHAFNARTHEVRYAFSPQDFGFGPTIPIAPEPHTVETPRSRRRPPQRDAETEEDSVPASLEDVEDVEDDLEPLETSLESLDEGQDDEEEDDVFKLDAPVEDTDEDDEDNVLDDEEDNVFEDDEV